MPQQLELIADAILTRLKSEPALVVGVLVAVIVQIAAALNIVID